MNKLIRFEIKKLFKNKSFYICIIISAVLIILNSLISKSVADATKTIVDSNSNILKFTSSGMLTMILGIFTAIFVTDDYTSNTMKNIYAKGYSRNEVYLSKYIVSTIGAFFFLAVSLLLDILISNALFAKGAVSNNTFISSILMEFIIILAYNSLFFIISMIIGKLGSSIAFCIVGPSVISLLLTLLDSFLKIDNFKLTSYWLDNCLSTIQVVNCESSAIISSLIISIVVIFASILLGLKLNSKKEF